MSMRYARVNVPSSKTGSDFAVEVERYLPSRYSVIATVISDPTFLVIAGEDNAGWTLDDYVIPRLGSGNIYAREITDTYTQEDGDNSPGMVLDRIKDDTGASA